MHALDKTHQQFPRPIQRGFHLGLCLYHEIMLLKIKAMEKKTLSLIDGPAAGHAWVAGFCVAGCGARLRAACADPLYRHEINHAAFVQPPHETPEYNGAKC